VITNAICSKSTIRKAQSLLEGVVENGTAMNLKNSNYRIAGKTGTAQIANAKHGYRSGARVSYQASFVGYFPADDPLYSCIVVVNAPSNWVYYGNVVSGPVFKEVADKVYASSFYRDLEALNTEDKDKVTLSEAAQEVEKNDLSLTEGLMPNVVGMGLRDALYMLENSGVRVRYTGRGKVAKQSPQPGVRISRGATVAIQLRQK
jgi:cell division protein FtsI (penicillin-binding protein 3)